MVVKGVLYSVLFDYNPSYQVAGPGPVSPLPPAHSPRLTSPRYKPESPGTLSYWPGFSLPIIKIEK